MNYIVFDLEATCWEKPNKRKNETIEIGAVLLNERCQKIAQFERFIKPKVNPILSDFCTSLTSIQQTDIDGASSFPRVVEEFKSWFEYTKNDYWLCSWGYYDKKQLRQDCALHGMDDQWVERHISLKHQHQKINNLSRAMGMKSALRFDNLSLEGTHHRGIDDAKNISKIFTTYFGDWKFTPSKP